MQYILNTIGKGILTVALAVSSIFGYAPATVQAPQNVGATVPVVVATFQTSLQASITASATSMTLVSGTNSAGNSISGYTCFNIDEGTSVEEFVCGTASGTAVTSMIRGIDPVDGDLEVTALKKIHRRGASVKITNYPSLAIVSRIINGSETFPNTISYANGVTPTASSDLTDKEYVLSVVSGGAVSFEKVVLGGIAGETVTTGQLVYLKSSDHSWWLTDADTASTVENVILGIAQGAGTAGNTITGGVLVQGIDENQSGLTSNTIYYASNTAGGLSTSAGTKEVTIGVTKSTTAIIFSPRYNQQVTEDEQDAIAGGSTFGTPSSTNKFVTQDYLSSATGLPVVRTYTTASTAIGSSTTQFDITNPSGTTFRYTWDSTGTDPTISLASNPVGSLINLQGQNFASGNKGVFAITGAGTSYFEITNASGVAESDKTIGTGYVVESGATGWSKPSGLKYITVEVQAGGGGGSSTAADGSGGNYSVGIGGGGGGYSKEKIQASSLSSTEYYLVGAGGATDSGGRVSYFGNYLSATGGIAGGVQCSASGALGGVGSGGDVNLHGSPGSPGIGCYATAPLTSRGGDSFLGAGAEEVYATSGDNGANGVAYGGGGGGGLSIYNNGSRTGGTGADGIIIITENFN